MHAGMPIDYFIESIFNYPTLAECYKVAALDGINRGAARSWTTGEAEPMIEPLKAAQPLADRNQAPIQRPSSV